jgi:mRNA-degrading endonuclease RelE of RelBE toxin-antitoxin system
MSWKSEISSWISTLREELNEIPYTLDQLDQKIEIDPKIKQKLKKVSELLSKSIQNFIKKSLKLRSQSILTDQTLKTTRDDYLRLMNSAESFFTALHQSNLKPKYTKSTFTSRIKTKQIPQKSISRSRSVKNSSNFSSLDLETCGKINKIVKKVDSHKHKILEDKLQRLETEISKNQGKVDFMREEVQESLDFARSLMKRLNVLDPE